MRLKAFRDIHFCLGCSQDNHWNRLQLGIRLDANEDFPTQPCTTWIVLHQERLEGHLFAQTERFPDHAWLRTVEDSRLPGNNFGRDFYCDGLAGKVNSHLLDPRNLVNELPGRMERQMLKPLSESRSMFLLHRYKLHTHSFFGLTPLHDSPRPHLSCGNIKQQLDKSAGRRRLTRPDV
jgi:hypothetical protein